MKPLKDRKTELQSKKKVVAMMNLFEKYIDEKIISINLEQSYIEGEKYDYRVDISANVVQRIYPDPDW